MLLKRRDSYNSKLYVLNYFCLKINKKSSLGLNIGLRTEYILALSEDFFHT